MRVWRPVRSLGGIVGVVLALLLWGGAAWLATMLPAPLSWQTFWLALGVLLLSLLGIVFLYWSVAFFTLRYAFDRNALTLHWGASRQVIPMNRITAIRQWAEGEVVRERGLHWPGYHRGAARSAGLGKVGFYATVGRPAQVVVGTADGAFALSPRNPAEFIQEMEVRRNLGITRQLAQERQHWWLFGWSVWQDRALLILLVLTLLVNFSLFALICYSYPTLPPLIPTHFSEISEGGQSRIVADIIGQSKDLFKLPAFGLLLFGGNTVLSVLLHQRHRPLVLLLAAVALVVQVLFWLGALFILYR